MYNRGHIFFKSNIKNISTIFSHWKKKSKKRLFIFKDCVIQSLITSKFIKYLSFFEFKQKKMAFNFRTWLNYAIPILWDRWEAVQTIKKFIIKNINVAENHEGYLKSVDFNDFIDKSQCQSWNSEIFKSIIDFTENGKQF